MLGMNIKVSINFKNTKIIFFIQEKVFSFYIKLLTIKNNFYIFKKFKKIKKGRIYERKNESTKP